MDPKLGSVWLPWQGNPTPSVCDTNRGHWELTELKRFKSDDIAVPAPGVGQFDEGSFATTPIGGHDSHFLMFTPAQ